MDTTSRPSCPKCKSESVYPVTHPPIEGTDRPFGPIWKAGNCVGTWVNQDSGPSGSRAVALLRDEVYAARFIRLARCNNGAWFMRYPLDACRERVDQVRST